MTFGRAIDTAMTSGDRKQRVALGAGPGPRLLLDEPLASCCPSSATSCGSARSGRCRPYWQAVSIAERLVLLRDKGGGGGAACTRWRARPRTGSRTSSPGTIEMHEAERGVTRIGWTALAVAVPLASIGRPAASFRPRSTWSAEPGAPISRPGYPPSARPPPSRRLTSEADRDRHERADGDVPGPGHAGPAEDDRGEPADGQADHQARDHAGHRAGRGGGAREDAEQERAHRGARGVAERGQAGLERGVDPLGDQRHRHLQHPTDDGEDPAHPELLGVGRARAEVGEVEVAHGGGGHRVERRRQRGGHDRGEDEARPARRAARWRRRWAAPRRRARTGGRRSTPRAGCPGRGTARTGPSPGSPTATRPIDGVPPAARHEQPLHEVVVGAVGGEGQEGAADDARRRACRAGAGRRTRR